MAASCWMRARGHAPLIALVVAVGLRPPAQAAPDAGDVVLSRRSGGVLLRVRPEGLAIRHADGSVTTLDGPEDVAAQRDSGDAVVFGDLHAGVSELWRVSAGRVHHEVRIEGPLQGVRPGEGDVLVISWLAVSDVPTDRWLPDAGALRATPACAADASPLRSGQEPAGDLTRLVTEVQVDDTALLDEIFPIAIAPTAVGLVLDRLASAASASGDTIVIDPRLVDDAAATASSYRASPICGAGGPYTSQCEGVTLGGAAASDADGDPLTFLWESDCDRDGVFDEPGDGRFDDATVLSAVFHAPAPCGSTCEVRLTADDGNSRACTSTTTVTVDDTTPPILDFGGTLALGPAVTYFPRTQQGGPMLHSHGMVYERPQLTVWWTDYELPDNVYEFDATQPPGSTLTALSQFTVTAGGIEDITFDPNDQSLWYVDLSGTVRHVDQTGVPLPPVGGFPAGGQYGIAWANGFLWVDDPNVGATQYTLAGVPTGRVVRYAAPPEYGLGYDFDRDLLWTSNYDNGRFRAYDEDTGALVFTSSIIVLPNGNGAGHDLGYGACHLWVGTETLPEDVIYAIPIEGDICDISVECDEIPPPAQPTAMDDCNGRLPVVFDENVIPGNCANEYTIVRTWTATDACGNDVVRSQRISVFDVTPPRTSCPGPASFECAADVPPCDPTDVAATDNCPPADVTCLPDIDNGGAGCAGDPLVITRTWNVRDGCGRTASCSQTITVVDATGPVLSARTPAGPCDVLLSAASGPGDVAIASPAVDVTGGCGVRVVNDRTSGGADATDVYPCGLTVVTFDAQDACGLTASCRIAVSVAPASAPPLVGSALRVRKDGAGAPVLDWSLAGPGAGPRFCVLRSENDPRDLFVAPPACGISARSWTEPAPMPRLICYDVRSMDCSGALSAE